MTAAKAAYKNYMDVQNAVGQDYFRGWDTEVIPLLVGDFAWNRRNAAQKYDGGQYYQVGEDKILTLTVMKSDEWEVVMNVCIDSSSVHIIGPDGVSVHDGSLEPWLSVVTVMRGVPIDEQGNPIDDSDPFGQEWWRVAGSVWQEGATCSS
ncbi:MAG: hypothetical protein FWH11_02245 [Micrococcales bacterium]|nr:hypothetical protein [Micrococcales bacterium]